MNIITVEEPAAEPVSMGDVYLHLRLTPSEPDADHDNKPWHPDDALLASQLVASRVMAEKYTRRAFVRQKLRLVTNRFPCFRVRFGGFHDTDDDYVSRNGYLELKRPPLIEMDSVKYRDAAAGTLITVNSANYYVSLADLVPRLAFVDAFDTPAVASRDDAVQVDYFAGYPDDTAPAPDPGKFVPEGIKQAILIGVQLMYDQLATDQRTKLELARDSLLDGFRVPSL